ncbi:DUF1574 family protein [Anaerosalibacter bizertensis]|uniref:DUF1574 family protein n=1 Tax=Anaerosalibacter bizertensis TaxID=932217 RepID=UPI0035156965
MKASSYTSNSKKKKPKWLNLTLFIIILLILLHYIGNYYEKISNENAIISDYKKTWMEFYDLEPNSIDLVFIGSSHSYCTFDPEIIDNALGTNSFNFGSPLQHADSSYYILKEILKYHKPKAVVFEIYWDMIDDEFELKQADTVINAINNNEFKREFIYNVFPINEMIKYVFRPVRFQQDMFSYWNKKLVENVEKYIEPIEKKQNNVEGVSHYKSKGFIYSDIIIPEEKFYKTNQFIGFDGAKWDFNNTQKSYVEKLVQLCNKKDIKVVFVTAPVANISMEHINNYDILHNKISNFAKKLDVPYIDYNIVNKEKKLLVNENFRDDAHLNYSGVEIVMKDFINWYKKILNNY